MIEAEQLVKLHTQCLDSPIHMHFLFCTMRIRPLAYDIQSIVCMVVYDLLDFPGCDMLACSAAKLHAIVL